MISDYSIKNIDVQVYEETKAAIISLIVLLSIIVQDLQQSTYVRLSIKNGFKLSEIYHIMWL